MWRLYKWLACFPLGARVGGYLKPSRKAFAETQTEAVLWLVVAPGICQHVGLCRFKSVFGLAFARCSRSSHLCADQIQLIPWHLYPLPSGLFGPNPQLPLVQFRSNPAQPILPKRPEFQAFPLPCYAVDAQFGWANLR